MSKIAIISQPNEGVLIDVSGCNELPEAMEHLSSTLQASSQFWSGLNVSINVGALQLDDTAVAKVLAVCKGVGIMPSCVYTTSDTTAEALSKHGVSRGEGTPMTLPKVSIDPDRIGTAEVDGAEDEQSPIASIKVRFQDAIAGRRKQEPSFDNDLQDMSPIDDQGEKIRATIAKRKITLTGDKEADDTESATVSASTVTEEKEPVEESGVASIEEEEFELDTETVPDEPTQEDVPAGATTLYLRQTLRSGQTVSHKGNLIIIGDVNPGAEIMAEGDITVWGCLRGIAHAGIGGNVEAEIRALNLQPIQIRIAHAIARAPDKPRFKYSSSHGPETARLVLDKIRVFRSRLE